MNLIEASKQGNLLEVRELLADGANIDEMGSPSYGSTRRCTALYAASESNRLLVMHCLLQMGADVEQGNGYWTPLHVAISENPIDAVRLLLQSGSNIDCALDHIDDDNDPSHIAKWSPCSTFESVGLRAQSTLC
jgi:ankyrin repeat protein